MSAGSKSFGPFVDLVEIGRGPIGPVYKALDSRLDRVVALKVLLDPNLSAKHLRRFDQEAKLLGKLNSPEFLEIYEYGKIEGKPYISTEFVAGDNLAVLLEKSGPLTPALVLRRMIMIANALRGLHSQGYVHRNLKPKNLFVVDGMIKIADFGLARLQVSSDSLTFSVERRDRSCYLAPEILLNWDGQDSEVDSRADLFALCAMAYEWLTGEHAFIGKNQTEIQTNLVDGNINKTKLWSAIPKNLRLFIERGLSPDRTARCDDVNEFIAECQKIEAALTAPNNRSLWGVTALLGCAVIVVGVLNLLSAQRRAELETSVTQIQRKLRDKEVKLSGIAKPIDPNDFRSIQFQFNLTKARFYRCGELPHELRAATHRCFELLKKLELKRGIPSDPFKLKRLVLSILFTIADNRHLAGRVQCSEVERYCQSLNWLPNTTPELTAQTSQAHFVLRHFDIELSIIKIKLGLGASAKPALQAQFAKLGEQIATVEDPLERRFFKCQAGLLKLQSDKTTSVSTVCSQQENALSLLKDLNSASLTADARNSMKDRLCKLIVDLSGIVANQWSELSSEIRQDYLWSLKSASNRLRDSFPKQSWQRAALDVPTIKENTS